MKKNLLATLGFILLFSLTTYAIHTVFTTQVIGALDFYPRWKGTQLFFLDGVDPYSQEATEAIQTSMRGGRLSRPGADQFLYVYPFYTSFLLLPLLPFGLPYAWIQAIWFATILFAGLGGVILCQRLVEWEQSPLMVVFTLFWAVGFYHTSRTILLGQFAGLVFFFLVATLFSLKQRHDAPAGLLLALTTIKPQMSFLIVPALLIWGFGQKRWRFVGGFGLTMALLTGASFLLLPNWLSGMIEQITAYPSYTGVGSALWVITQFYWPALGTPVQTALIVLLMGYLLYQWRYLPTASFPHLLWLVGLTLLIGNLVVVRTATTNYMVLYIPIFVALKQLVDQKRWGSGAAILFFISSAVASWWLFLSTIQGDLEHPVMYLPLPIIIIAALIWTRQAWVKNPSPTLDAPHLTP